MKFNVNVNYEVEAESFDEAQAIVPAVTETRTFATGTAELTGVNMNKAYVPVEATDAVGIGSATRVNL